MAAINTDYLIIGNSAAGISGAEKIRECAPDASITIVSNEPYRAYGRPLISYLIEGKTNEDSIWLRSEDFYASNRFDSLLGPEYRVTELLPDTHQAMLADGTVIEYGKCLLATGSVPFVPPIKGLEGLSNVFGFMTLDDAKSAQATVAEAAKNAAEEGRESRVVVIGAGLIGLKAAEALSSYVDEVLVLELAPRILPAVLDSEGAKLLQAQLEEHGIKCLPGISADEVLSEAGTVSGVLLTNGEQVGCDVLITAVGVRPNSALAVAAGAEQGRGLICDETLQTTLPDVYAAGDVVQVTDLLDGSEHPLALWPNAVQQGKLAGYCMAGATEAETFEGSFAINAVDFFDASLLTSGVINPPEDEGYDVEVFADGNQYSKFVSKDDRLMGYILLNRPDNAGIYTSLIENAVPISSLSSDIFECAPTNLNLPDERRWARLHKGYPSNMNRLGQVVEEVVSE